MILVVDNHDSFTFNLVHCCVAAGAEVEVVRADAIDATEAIARGDTAVLISPGPGRPEDAGASISIVRECVARGHPLLGVCLGQQAIAAALGGSIVRAARPMHGKTSRIVHHASDLFADVPSPFTATRYHSLVVKEETLPPELVVTARAQDVSIQAIAHRTLPIRGVQFHPESIASPWGPAIIRNFVALALSAPSRAYRP